MICRTLRDVDETYLLGTQIARWILPGDVITLRGPMGAGKTTFTAAIVQGLGITEAVRSPTYTLANEYRGSDRIIVAHVDLYRDAGRLHDDAWWSDIAPGIDRATVSIIEWPEVGLEQLADRVTLDINLNYSSTNPTTGRTICLVAKTDDDRRAALVSACVQPGSVAQASGST